MVVHAHDLGKRKRRRWTLNDTGESSDKWNERTCIDEPFFSAPSSPPHLLLRSISRFIIVDLSSSLYIDFLILLLFQSSVVFFSFFFFLVVVGEVGYDWGGWIGFLTLSFLNFVAREQHEIGCNFSFLFFRGYFLGGYYFWKIIFNTFDSKIWSIYYRVFLLLISKDFSGKWRRSKVVTIYMCVILSCEKRKNLWDIRIRLNIFRCLGKVVSKVRIIY